MTGDSTDPANPAAGGAHPEEVDLMKGPGGTPEASVTPLTPPGTGDTGDGDKAQTLGMLFSAIADFLKGGGASSMPMDTGSAPRFAFGTLPRYADGTSPGDTTSVGIATPQTAADQPYLDQIAGLRAGVQYPNLNPYSTKFSFQPQSMQDAYYAGQQEKFGVPVADQQQQQQQLALQGTVNRGSYGYVRGPFTLGV